MKRSFAGLVLLWAVCCLAAEVRLTTDPADDEAPCWSPDGSKIAFCSNRNGDYNIWVMNNDGTNQIALTSFIGSDEATPCYSPDGNTIAFNRIYGYANGDVWLMNANGSSPTQLTTGGGGYRPTYSPDGTAIAFHSYRDGGIAQIYRVPSTGGTETQLTYDEENDCDRAAWSPDGNIIAFKGYQFSFYADICTIPEWGGTISRVTYGLTGCMTPAWSPDGRFIAFSCHQSGYWEIWLVNVLDHTSKRLTYDNSYNDVPAWSPDGKKIAFTGWRPDTGYDIYVIDVDFSKVQPTSLGNIKALYGR